MMVCAGASVAFPVPRSGHLRPGSLARSGVLVCLVAALAASGGGHAGRAAPATQPSDWSANGPLGLEQGFTLQHRPTGHGKLTFTVGLAGSLAATAIQRGQTVWFGSLAYRGLVVTDARGHTLPAHMQLSPGRLLISV